MRHWMISLLLAIGTGWVTAFDVVIPVTPESLLAEGQQLEEQGKWAPAAEKYRAAVRLRPDYLEGHLRLVTVLRTMLPQTLREAEQAALVQEIRDGYAAAAKCSGADWRVYSQWAGFLTDVMVARAATAAERQLFFEEALLLTDSAVLQASPGADLARAQLQRAMLLVVMAGEVADGERQFRMYSEASELFGAVSQTAPLAMADPVQDAWSVAILHCGRLSGDREKKQVALDRLRAAVAETPTDLVRRYNLACAHAALGEADAAYEELERCLRSDPSALIFSAVAKDVEWARWRDEERFQKLLARYDPAVNAAFERGRELQAAAERVGSNQVAAQNLREAIASYRMVTSRRPEFVAAWWHLAECYQRLGALTVSVEDRRSLWQSASEAYRQATRVAPTDGQLWLAWGRLMTREMVVLAAGDAAAQDRVLREGRGILEEALRLAESAGERARVQLDLAATEVRLGRLTTAEAERLPWFESAVARLQQIVNRDEIAATATPYALWGLAQLETGRLQRNRIVLRQAVERFQTAIERAPTDPEIRYNLACTYALLALPDEALRQLRICFENDPTRRLAGVAQSDRDFDSIRNLPAFAELLQNAAVGAAIAPGPAPARISGY